MFSKTSLSVDWTGIATIVLSFKIDNANHQSKNDNSN